MTRPINETKLHKSDEQSPIKLDPNEIVKFKTKEGHDCWAPRWTIGRWEKLERWREPPEEYASGFQDLKPSGSSSLSLGELKEAGELWSAVMREFDEEGLMLTIEDNRNPQSLVGSSARAELERRADLLARKQLRQEMAEIMDACTPAQKAKYWRRSNPKKRRTL